MNGKKMLKYTLMEMLNLSKNIEDFMALSESLKRKIERNIIYTDVPLSTFQTIREEVLSESILDPVRKERFKLIFDKEDRLKQEAKEWIMKKIKEWQKGISFVFEIKHIRLYGSSTGYQYTDTTDIDLHALTTLTDEQIKETGKLIKLGNLFDNDKNPVTLFLLSIDEKEELKKYENLYDFETDIWIKKSDKNEYEVPYGYILELSEFFMNAFDLSLSQYERAKHEYKTYLALDPEVEEITTEEKKRVVERSLLELKAAHDRLRLGKQILQSFARDGYEEGRDFQIHIIYNASKDPRLSVNNAVNKMLERFGYKKKMDDALQEAKNIIPGDENSMLGN